MDFFSVLTNDPEKLIQIAYVALLVFLIVVQIPRMNNAHSKERDKYLAVNQESTDKFLEVIESYREALVNFQQKEDESHHNLAAMMGDCRQKVAAEHKEIMRGLKSIAVKLDADIID